MNEAFSHRSARSALLMTVVIFLVAVECTVAHFLLHPYFPTFGFIITAFGVVSLGWMVWDYRLLGRATTLVTADSIVLRVGLRAKAIVPLRLVQSVSTPSWSDLSTETQRLLLDLTKPTDPNILLVLSEPVPVKLLGALQRPAQQIALSIDRPTEFQTAVNNAREAMQFSG
jgi:hypothetical protein